MSYHCTVGVDQDGAQSAGLLDITSSGSRNFGEGGQETWNISRRARQPSFFGLFLQGGGGPWPPWPPPWIRYWLPPYSEYYSILSDVLNDPIPKSIGTWDEERDASIAEA